MGASILERSNWVDNSIDLYVGNLIEYDMVDGGLNIIKEYKLLPPFMIDQIESLPKGIKRNQFVGKLKYNKTYKDIPKIQNDKFKELRIRFGENNELTDKDIFSVRKDAIFTKRFCYNTKIGEYVEFREKNIYDAFMRIGKLEFYWAKVPKVLDVKGIRDSNILKKHDGFLNELIWEFIKHLSRFDELGARRYIVSMIDKYKFIELPAGYYRMYDSISGYQLILNGSLEYIEDIGDSEITATNIAYNFNNLLVPMLRLVDK